jgi:hypothetical protein
MPPTATIGIPLTLLYNSAGVALDAFAFPIFYISIARALVSPPTTIKPTMTMQYIKKDATTWKDIDFKYDGGCEF